MLFVWVVYSMLPTFYVIGFFECCGLWARFRFGHSGSRSVIILYESESGFLPWFLPYVTSFWLLSMTMDVIVPSSTKQKTLKKKLNFWWHLVSHWQKSRIRIGNSFVKIPGSASGSVQKCHWFTTLFFFTFSRCTVYILVGRLHDRRKLLWYLPKGTDHDHTVG